MPTKDPRVDAYIAAAAPFARPILRHLRKLVHTGCPQVVETMKWSFPHFDHHGVLCSMAAFQQHCTFGFWKGKLIVGHTARENEAMGQFGRIATLADLPDDRVLMDYIRKAVAVNESGVKKSAPARARTPKRLVVPAALQAALRDNPAALRTFQTFSPSHRREYVEWIVEAKREDTRARRLVQAIEWLAEGKSRNWKYAGC